MSRTYALSFANLTCRFGDQFVLLDLANEVVLPAFFQTANRRKYGLNNFFFRNVGVTLVAVEDLLAKQLVVFGRIINSTTLVRNQTYSEEGGLQADDASLASAPSSFFALDINNHKLMFLPETPAAPTIYQFAVTLQSFARTELAAYLRALAAASKEAGERRTLTSLYAEYPAPDVKVTPLSSEDNVEAFISNFAKITRMEVTLLSTNAEFNQEGNFRALRAMKDEVGSSTTRLVHENSSGLRKETVTSEAKEAANGGNQRLRLLGTAEDGARLSGNNEDFKLQVDFPDPPETLVNRAASAIRSYFSQITQGRLKPDFGRPNEAKLAVVEESLRGRIQ